MKIVKGKGIGSQCQECSRSNIPVLQIIKSIRYCQRCLREAFQDYAEEQQWKENKHANFK